MHRRTAMNRLHVRQACKRWHTFTTSMPFEISHTVNAFFERNGQLDNGGRATMPVILSAAKNLHLAPREILRCAQNDRRGDSSERESERLWGLSPPRHPGINAGQ